MERSISHKVGIKLLTDTQLANVLPTYGNLFHKIEVCRNVAGEILQMKEKRHYQYNFMYDNVFSLLGQRGTGKTSVAFTMQKKIREMKGDGICDVVLPLIIPEAIPENCAVLGWILAIVGEEIEELEERISNLEKEDRKAGYWERCRYQNCERGKESLTAKLDRMNQLFYAGSYNPANEPSYHKAVGNSVLQSGDYYKFAKEIAGLWDAWIRRIIYCYTLENPDMGENGQKLCPLIYFIFDDVDLAPEKIEEILSVITKYLSHPNIIVITTADEALFLEVIEKKQDQKIGRLSAEWKNYLARSEKYLSFRPSREKEEEEEDNAGRDTVNQTTRMYLGKVLPTSTRYYLRQFKTAREKALFCLEDGWNLGNGVWQQVDKLIRYVDGGTPGQTVNFIGAKDNIVHFYIKFMGCTSRQIGNVYIALCELMDSLIGILENGEGRDSLLRIYYHCNYFIHVAINANHELSMLVKDVDQFVDTLFPFEYNQWKLYCNYPYLNEFLKQNMFSEHREGGQKIKNLEMGLQLYSLLVFVENILLILEYGVRDGITKRKKIHAVKSLTRYIGMVSSENRYVFRNDLSSEVFFRHYSNLLDRLGFLIQDNLDEPRFNMEYFYDFIGDNKSDLTGWRTLLDISISNRQWFHEIIGRLFLVYGNAYLIGRQNMEDCLCYQDKSFLTRYQRTLLKGMKTNMEICFYPIKMHEEWNRIKDTFYRGFQEGMQIIDEKEVLEGGESENFRLFVEHIRDLLIETERENSSSYLVGLNRILELVVKAKINIKETSAEQRTELFLTAFISRCPNVILQDVQKKHMAILSNYKEIRSLLQKYKKLIERSDYLFDNKALLLDPDNVINVLKKLQEDYPFVYPLLGKCIEKLAMALMRIEITDNEPISEIVIGKELYRDISAVLNRIFENEYFQEDEEGLKREVEEAFAGLDILIDVRNSEELAKAVILGMEVIFVKILQQIYIYLVISERYHDINNMSSRSLEKIWINGELEDSYYFNFFKLAVSLLESDVDKNGNGELLELRDEIEYTYRSAREAYCKSLMVEEGYEQI